MKKLYHLACITVMLCLTTYLSAEDKPKNIVLILANDLGWADTTLYGKTSLYETPNIQRLATRGMELENSNGVPMSRSQSRQKGNGNRLK